MKRNVSQPGRTAFRPRLEPMEDRNLPSQFGPWSAPVNLGSVVNTPSSDQHPAISPDGLSLYITSNRPGGNGSQDLWVSQRDSKYAAWETPANLGTVINGVGRDFSPVFSPDGHWMIYARAPGADENGDDLYISHRADKRDNFGWETPVSLGPNINVPGFGDSGPALFEDPATGLLNLYFTSNRPGGLGDWDIYRSVRQESGTFTPAELVSEVSSSLRDVRNTIRGDGLEMILTVTNPAHLPAPNPQAPLDLYVSTRASTLDPWSTPVNLGTTVNSPSPTVADSAPYLSRDGKSLFFYSNRGGSLVGNDLFMCTRKELDDNDVERSRFAFAAPFADGPLPTQTLAQKGNGFLAPFSYAVDTNPVAVATDDFVGDRVLDLVIANGGPWAGSGNDSVDVLLVRSDGSFQPPPTVSLAGGGIEDTEFFFLDLFGNSSNSLFTKNRGIGTILNDD